MWEQATRTRRPATVIVALVVSLAVLVAASLCIGSLSTGLGETWRILMDGHTADPSGSEVAVLTFRVPRTAVILLVGAGLGAAGTLTQGLTRNPLADPALLGISGGAALAVVIGLSFLSVTTPMPQLALAFAGAAVASTVVFLLGSAGGRVASPIALIIAGAAVSALLLAVTTTLILRDSSALDRYRFWTAGSVAASEPDAFVPAIGFMVVGVVVAFVCTPGLNLLTMGEQSAQSLGLSITKTRILAIVAITLLAGGATAIAGPIAFLGLIAPHLARALVGADYRLVLPVSALAATAVLFVADIVGRVIAVREVPAGIMMVIVGVPFFLVAIRRSRFVQAS